MLHSIRWRIALPYLLLILGVMAGLGVYLSRFVRQTYLNNLEQELSAEARLAADVLADELSAGPDGGAPTADLDAQARAWAASLNKRVTIIAADGRVLGESHEDRAQMENHAGRPEIVQAQLTGQGSATRYSQTVDYDMLYVATTVRSRGALVGFVRLAVPLSQVQANLNHLQRAWGLATLAAAALAALLAVWIAASATRPLRDLNEAAAHMGQGQWDSRLIPRTQDEIGQLTRTFNAMADQLHIHLQALEVERSRMAAVLGGMTDGAVIVDQAGLIQLVNPAAEGLFDLEPDAAIGQSLMQALRAYQINDLWQQSLQSNEAQTSPLEIAPRQMVLQCSAIPLGRALPGSTLLLFQNLTRLRRLETVRRDFISNLSHELRTPLASLKALTETLQDGALDDPPAAQRFLDRMLIEVDALSQMVEELLELSRIESGRVPLRLAPVDPADLLAAAVERLGVQAERAGLTIGIDCPSDLPPVLADAARLQQVLVNLLHNAIKFTPSGGQIRLSAAARPGQVVFSVQDTGVGIPVEDRPRIFERFFKADRARAGGGTGLGLAIARHLVEAHGGRIWVESVEGRGSVFSFEIPAAAD